MASKQINPFIALLVIMAVAVTGMIFVVNKISKTDFTYSHTDARVGVTARELLKSP